MAAGPAIARLLRLHQSSRSNVLVVGGTRSSRLAVARAFHRRSPLASFPLAVVDCGRDEARLVRSLEHRLLAGGPVGVSAGEVLAGAGVLYLESVSALSEQAQRLLLMVAHRLQATSTAPVPAGPYRLMAGDRYELHDVAETGRFSAALADHLDKIRVELGRRLSRGAA